MVLGVNVFINGGHLYHRLGEWRSEMLLSYAALRISKNQISALTTKS